MRHVVMFSSGAGSWAAARRVADQHGTDDLVLLFADVKGEDEDNYRFLHEAAADIGGELVVVSDGRTIWDVFRDDRFLGNTRLANCSKFLKQKPAREWLDANCDPADTTVYVGVDWSEMHRLPAIERGYEPYVARAPLCDPPFIDRRQVFDELKRRGIRRPRLYDMGMEHANCGGGCVRAGQGQFARLLEVMPDRFAEWERQEEGLRTFLGKDVSILRERSREYILGRLGLSEADVEVVTDGERFWDDDAEEWREPRRYEVVKETGESLPTMLPLTLTEFRQRAESKPDQLDLFDIGGCGCFVAEESA